VEKIKGVKKTNRAYKKKYGLERYFLIDCSVPMVVI